MTPRRLGLFVGLAAIAVLGPRWSRAEGMKYQEAQPVYQSEGSNPITFNVSCATGAWTIVIASDTISRSTFMESISSNTQNICLLPVTNGVAPTVAISSQCTTASPGPELVPSSSLTDYSRAGWACASSSGTVVNTIKGYRTRDKRDTGWIGASGLQ